MATEATGAGPDRLATFEERVERIRTSTDDPYVRLERMEKLAREMLRAGRLVLTEPGAKTLLSRIQGEAGIRLGQERTEKPWGPYLDTNNLFVQGEIFPSGIVVVAYLEREPGDGTTERRYIGTRVYSWNAPGQTKAVEE